MKKFIKRLVVSCFILLSSNLAFASLPFSLFSSLSISQEDQNDLEQEENNSKRNDEAIGFLNDIIKNLEADKKADKAEALKAMRDHIKKNRKNDTGTTLDEAADEAKKTTEGKVDIKALKEYIDKIHSATAKKVFGLNLVARGTGRTTGHIADLTITNNSENHISLRPETVYIVSVGKYQSYISHIPENVTVPPGTTMTIPIPGYCANPHVPPVPDNESMPSPSEWIPIDVDPEGGFEIDGKPPSIPEPMNPSGGSLDLPIFTTPIYVSNKPPLPAFDPGMIPIVQGSSGFTKEEDADTDGGIKITYPGTEKEVDGTINPEKDPEIFAQVATVGLTQIIDKVDTIQNSGIYTTPFSNNKEKEKEAIIQQTFWIFVAALIGEEYEKEDFAENVYEQFKTATGKSVTSLPTEQQKQVDEGVEDFWDVYTAVGTEAKIFNVDNAPTIPISNPEIGHCCDSTALQNYNPKLDFEMKIAKEWANESERAKIIKEANESMESDMEIFDGEAFEEYEISKNPTSSTSFWKPGVVGGFASAHAKTWFNKGGNNWEWLWGTNELKTEAKGTMKNSLSYDNTGDSCRAIVAGTALIRVRASSSAFDPVAGNRQNENDTEQLEFVRGVKYAGKLALEYLIMRGRGKTNKSFKDFAKEEMKDDLKEEMKDALEEEIQKFAEKNLNEYLDALGIEIEDLNRDMFDVEKNLEELLGIEIPTTDDIENALSDVIDASLNLFFVASTYATAEGRLTAKVGNNIGTVSTFTSVIYGREALETTEEAMSWSAAKCQEKIISDVQPNSLTISTDGYANMIAEAVSKYGFGNGSAKAFLESMSLQMLVGLCVYVEDGFTKFKLDSVTSLHWYGKSDKHQEQLKSMADAIEKDILKSLEKEIAKFQNVPGNTSLENYTGEMLKNSIDQKIRKWAADNPFYWKDCSN